MNQNINNNLTFIYKLIQHYAEGWSSASYSLIGIVKYPYVVRFNRELEAELKSIS